MTDATLPRPWSLARKLAVAYVATALLGVATAAVLVHFLVVLADHVQRLLALDVALNVAGLDERAAAIQDVQRAMWCTGWVLAAAGLWVGGLAVLLARMVKTLRRRHHELCGYLQRVESANRDLDAFAGRVAHDVRNLLSPMIVVPAVLQRAIQLAPAHPAAATVKRAADGIERRLTAASRLIDALLAFSRGSEPDGAATTSVPAIIEEVLEELEPVRARVGAAIDRHLEDLPAQCAPGLVHVLVMNLLGNAIKFLEGRPCKRVRVACMEHEGSCCVEVQDSGPGIPAEHLDKVFEPFHRVPGVAAGGFGIGLATVRRIVDAHDGAVEVRSTVGVGTTVRVLLPAANRRPTPTAGTKPVRPPDLRL